MPMQTMRFERMVAKSQTLAIKGLAPERKSIAQPLGLGSKGLFINRVYGLL
jgi:hypothetical protein